MFVRFLPVFLCLLLFSVADASGQVRCEKPGKKFNVAFVGDPQVNDTIEFGYAEKSVYKELMDRNDLSAAVFSGDLVNDNTDLLPQTKSILDSMPYRCFSVPGNHDRDVYGKGHLRDMQTYRNTFGYTDTTFLIGKVQFILMNNVRHSPEREYEGGFTHQQKKWLQSSLETVPHRRLIVLVTHIPISHSAGSDTLFSILEGYRRLMLVAGHMHSVRRQYIRLDDGRTVHEVTGGAACGSWWRGVKTDGVPYALQNCGAPKGYFVCRFNGRDYTLDYKCIGKSEESRASAHIVSGRLLLNVFGGAEDAGGMAAKVTVRSVMPDGTKGCRYICRQISETAPEVQEVIAFNSTLSSEEKRRRKSDIIPLRRVASPHLWEAPEPLAAECSETENPVLEVRYKDRNMKFKCQIPATAFEELRSM